MKHLIFFDAACPFCLEAIKRVKERDCKEIFDFFPLNSVQAQEMLPETIWKRGDTLVFVEEGKIWLRGKAVMRILKRLEGPWSWIGVFYWLPGIDLLYRGIAKCRHLF